MIRKRMKIKGGINAKENNNNNETIINTNNEIHERNKRYYNEKEALIFFYYLIYKHLFNKVNDFIIIFNLNFVLLILLHLF